MVFCIGPEKWAGPLTRRTVCREELFEGRLVGVVRQVSYKDSHCTQSFAKGWNVGLDGSVQEQRTDAGRHTRRGPTVTGRPYHARPAPGVALFIGGRRRIR